MVMQFFWDVAPAHLASTSDLLALFKGDMTDRRQLAYVFTSDSRASLSDDTGMFVMNVFFISRMKIFAYICIYMHSYVFTYISIHVYL